MAYLSHPVSEPATPLVGYAGDLKSGVVSRESWLGAQCQRVGPEELIHGSRTRLESQEAPIPGSLTSDPASRSKISGGRRQRATSHLAGAALRSGPGPRVVSRESRLWLDNVIALFSACILVCATDRWIVKESRNTNKC